MDVITVPAPEGDQPPGVRLFVPGWRPATLNKLMGCGHWGEAARLKRADRDMVRVRASMAKVSRALGKRRVDLLVTLCGRQRAADPDAYWKSLLDALVHCGLLIDDKGELCQPGDVTHARGTRQEAGSLITLTDLDS